MGRSKQVKKEVQEFDGVTHLATANEIGKEVFGARMTPAIAFDLADSLDEDVDEAGVRLFVEDLRDMLALCMTLFGNECSAECATEVFGAFVDSGLDNEDFREDFKMAAGYATEVFGVGAEKDPATVLAMYDSQFGDEDEDEDESEE